ncbi:DUF7093 family protein [Halorubrum halodurans]|uniref:Uncharacterized protein n=1 Tax=Halorubrum halodurans TaxID=1383851 RepID=A0A256IAU1_9EURY|nr:hypothetical protein [Halorubrum halodurans]OYR53668.1 hypothetical protein DJ70_16030 [Halorubrum halodurans]
MGLRCLLGHDFSEPELEREREEDGEEVVTTVREVKTCARCGETQVVSENTEVTTMEQLADQAATAEGSATGGTEPAGATETPRSTGAADEPDGSDAAADPSPGAAGAVRSDDVERDRGAADVGAADPAGDDAEILEAGPVEDGPTVDDEPGDLGSDDASAGDPAVAADDEGAELIDDGPAGDAVDDAPDAVGSDGDPTRPDPAARSGTDGDDGAADAADASGSDGTGDGADDDGVILDAGGADAGGAAGDRDRGEWPEVEPDDDDGTFEATPWPEQRGEDEGFDAEVGGDGDSGVEFGGLTPEAADSTATSADTEYVEPTNRSSASAGGAAGGDGHAGATADAEEGAPGSGITREESPELETADAGGVPTEYYCPECGMTVESAGSSMRAGDICPECKRGYVAERSR